jgi:hypothetical protein
VETSNLEKRSNSVKILLAAISAFLLSAKMALATELLGPTTITTAVTNVVTQPIPAVDGNPQSALIQGTLTYGSGVTTVTALVETSVDDGTTWIDVVNFAFTTSTASFVVNLSAMTPVTSYSTTTALTSNTSKDGIVGSLWRVKYSSTGTYAGNTVLRVDISTIKRWPF